MYSWRAIPFSLHERFLVPTGILCCIILRPPQLLIFHSHWGDLSLISWSQTTKMWKSSLSVSLSLAVFHFLSPCPAGILIKVIICHLLPDDKHHIYFLIMQCWFFLHVFVLSALFVFILICFSADHELLACLFPPSPIHARVYKSIFWAYALSAVLSVRRAVLYLFLCWCLWGSEELVF